MIYFVHLNIQTPYFYAYSIPFRVIVKGFIHIHLLQTQSESERERESYVKFHTRLPFSNHIFVMAFYSNVWFLLSLLLVFSLFVRIFISLHWDNNINFRCYYMHCRNIVCLLFLFRCSLFPIPFHIRVCECVFSTFQVKLINVILLVDTDYLTSRLGAQSR